MLVLVLTLAACGNFGLAVVDGDVAGSRLTTDPVNELAFGRRAVDGTHSEQLYLRSEGTTPVYVADLWVESPDAGVFSTGDLPLPRELEPGAELPVQIRFTPDDDTRFEGTILIQVGREGRVLERSVVGTGCAARDC